MNKGEQILHSALQEYYGEKEVEGKDSNPRILKIIQWANQKFKDDSTVAWCAIFLSYLLNKCYKFDPSTLARSFLKFGKEVSDPKFGDIVIYWRGSKNSWKGHVGFVVRIDDHGIIWTFGGNQDNQVNIRPYSPSRVLGYRRMDD
jgi:uncharacterized protein (TIGR02594 family)